MQRNGHCHCCLDRQQQGEITTATNNENAIYPLQEAKNKKAEQSRRHRWPAMVWWNMIYWLDVGMAWLNILAVINPKRCKGKHFGMELMVLAIQKQIDLILILANDHNSRTVTTQ